MISPSEMEDPSFGQNCIGCSPRNPKGLHLHFVADGPDRKGVRADVRLDASYESYPGMIHGGIIALVLDEVTGRAALWHARRFVITVGFRLRFGAIMQPGVAYVARAEVESSRGDQLSVRGAIETLDGGLVAAATSTFLALPPDRLGDLPEAARALARVFEVNRPAAGRPDST
jgi:acyl-coenzyme A thioesterase PaaI-like protein